MNKQELISKYELLKNSYNFKVVATDGIISDLKRLDEPETGHADEAPRYVKNILARLRELPLHDREVWLKAIMGEFEQDFSHAKWREGYEQGKFEGEWAGQQLKDADKIRQELNKPVIPQFVADWIRKCKTFKHFAVSLSFALQPIVWEENNLSDKCIDWLMDANNQELYARAWLDGYEVEKEKKYLVKIEDIETNFNFLNRHKTENYWIFSSKDESFAYQVYHTRKELEEAGFGWVFDCPGTEVEEVGE